MKVTVHPLLQKSAVAKRDLPSSLSLKMCTSVEIGAVSKVPVAFDEIVSPLGSSTRIPPPAFVFCKNFESVLRKNVFVAPVSWMEEL